MGRSEEKIRYMSESRKGLEYQSMECLCNQFWYEKTGPRFRKNFSLRFSLFENKFSIVDGRGDWPFFQLQRICFLEKYLWYFAEYHDHIMTYKITPKLHSICKREREKKDMNCYNQKESVVEEASPNLQICLSRLSLCGNRFSATFTTVITFRFCPRFKGEENIWIQSTL